MLLFTTALQWLKQLAQPKPNMLHESGEVDTNKSQAKTNEP